MRTLAGADASLRVARLRNDVGVRGNFLVPIPHRGHLRQLASTSTSKVTFGAVIQAELCDLQSCSEAGKPMTPSGRNCAAKATPPG